MPRRRPREDALPVVDREPAAGRARQGPRHLRRQATTGCSSSRPTASRPTTWSCPRRSRRRAACSRSSRTSGSASSRTSCPTTSPESIPRRWSRPPSASRCAAARWWCGASRPCRSRPSCAATSRAPDGRNTRKAEPCAASRCRPGSSAPRGCPRRSSRPRPRPRRGTTTRTSPSSAWRPGSGRRARTKCATAALRLYQAAADLRARARHHHRRHEVRVRAGRAGPPASHRRGAYAGLLALLAARDLAPGSEPRELRQAVRAQLARQHRIRAQAARSGDAAPRWPAGPRRNTSKR